ncbi:MAG: uroporphyrinogen-III synthase [Bacteroidales bacterium]|nr:uroporphyrinogen-III synthase [Bacteroidales bacterium]
MKINKILVAQQKPVNMSPYTSLIQKYGVEIDFHRFFNIEPLTAREFRAQRVNLSDFTAVAFSSRHTIDAFFKLCDEFRFKVPETMKYFCTTEAVAMYLQKHIVYRKRKIFYGNGTAQSIIDLVGTKHKGEKFLISTSDSSSAKTISALFEANGLDFVAAAMVKPVFQDMKSVNLHDYDIIVLYNPNDVNSLKENFPDFEQGDIKFIAYGRTIVRAMEEEGLTIEVAAPTAEVPSAAKAIEICLKGLAQ